MNLMYTISAMLFVALAILVIYFFWYKKHRAEDKSGQNLIKAAIIFTFVIWPYMMYLTYDREPRIGVERAQVMRDLLEHNGELEADQESAGRRQILRAMENEGLVELRWLLTPKGKAALEKK